eukprot:CAMPEP_0115108666 /NCGR_PEP_ID=MMETSP0227-20121206/38144_1 /TAXON_ID=89957 /ORGANISM="Polarella glacialis, Strain CCMP 1383" /LENGTH=162 /DNA_ID=CAMNT_0002507013 /DNA_START=71 /DNA_END=560 /DNA_ORIENTATION=-
MSQSAAIEISGISETSSRLSLKKAMEAFGEVVGCHMGSRGQDNPIVRYKTQDMAQSALDALKKGTVWLDGVVLTAEWKGTSGTTRRDPPPGGGGGGGGGYDAGGRNEAGLDLTSRDFVTARRGGGDDGEEMTAIVTATGAAEAAAVGADKAEAAADVGGVTE